MFSRELEIKKSSGALIAKGFFYLMMLLLSVFCCLSAWIFYIDEKYADYITAVGFVSTLYFTYLFAYTIYRSMRPLNALVLTEKGIYDFVTDPGKGVFVNWENISSVKIFGSDTAPLLGIELYDSDILIESLRKNIAEEIRSNIQAGLPAIVIKQSDIGPSLPQVLPAFNEFISLTRPIPTVSSAPTANAQAAKKAPMSQKISDETTDDSILVVADAVKTAAEPAVNPKRVKLEKEDEIFILPPEPSVFEQEAEFAADKTENAEADSALLHSEKLSFDDFDFGEAPKSGAASKELFARTKEVPAAKAPAEPAASKQAQDAEKEEPQPAPKKEIKTLEELLAQFSVPTTKDKK